MTLVERETLAAFLAGQVDAMSRELDFKSFNMTASRDLNGDLIMGISVDSVRTNHIISTEYMEINHRIVSAINAGQEPEPALLESLEKLVEQGEFKNYG